MVNPNTVFFFFVLYLDIYQPLKKTVDDVPMIFMEVS